MSRGKFLRSRKRLVVVALVAVTLAIAPAAASSAFVFHTNETLPVNYLTNDCVGNTVEITGTFHVNNHITVSQPSGTGHFHLNMNSQELSGTDASGETLYRAVNVVINTSERSFTGGVITLPVSIRLIAQGPLPDLQFHSILHITVNANGEVTSTVIEERVSCD